MQINATSLSVAIRQELANSISHGVGILFAIIAIPILLAIAAATENVAGIIGASIYGFSFLFMYTSSTLYHSFQQPNIKKIFKTFDHISIYFLIAGSYTPFILIGMLNSTGILLLCILWTIVLLGTIFKIFFVGRFKLVSTLLYLGMGWMAVFVAGPFMEALSTATLTLIAAGGILYTIGVFFYMSKKLVYSHAIWHFFVFAASICHFVAVLLALQQ